MTNDELELSRDLTRLVRAVDGVLEVYATGGALTVAARAVSEAVSGAFSGAVSDAVSRTTSAAATSDLDDEARVAIAGDSVTVSVAVAAGFNAPDTLRAVGDAIAQHLASAGRGTRNISVRASRIEL